MNFITDEFDWILDKQNDMRDIQISGKCAAEYLPNKTDQRDLFVRDYGRRFNRLTHHDLMSATMPQWLNSLNWIFIERWKREKSCHIWRHVHSWQKQAAGVPCERNHGKDVIDPDEKLFSRVANSTEGPRMKWRRMMKRKPQEIDSIICSVGGNFFLLPNGILRGGISPFGCDGDETILSRDRICEPKWDSEESS